jgi:hypothetical protein
MTDAIILQTPGDELRTLCRVPDNDVIEPGAAVPPDAGMNNAGFLLNNNNDDNEMSAMYDHDGIDAHVSFDLPQQESVHYSLPQNTSYPLPDNQGIPQESFVGLQYSMNESPMAPQMLFPFNFNMPVQPPVFDNSLSTNFGASSIVGHSPSRKRKLPAFAQNNDASLG